MKGDVFTGIEKGVLPGELRFECYTPKDTSKPVEFTYKAAKDIKLWQLRLDSSDRLLFIPSPGKGECVTTPKVVLSNPSETNSPPNGPENGKNPLTNQFGYFNIPGWWDDTCGGEIDVTVTLKKSAEFQRDKDDKKMPKLWGTGGKPLQNQQLGTKMPDAFRVAKGTEPGSLAAYMSSPWQGDFWSCNMAWWPKLGMVLPLKAEDGSFIKDNGSTVFVEQERNPALNRPPVQGK